MSDSRDSRTCQHCATAHLVVRMQGRLCRTCYDYQLRHAGRPRPPALIEAAAQRRAGASGICRHCGDDVARTVRGFCKACYQYRWRTGHDRPAELCHPQPRHCGHCGVHLRGRMRKDICNRCYQYRWRTGRDRPAALQARRAS